MLITCISASCVCPFLGPLSSPLAPTRPHSILTDEACTSINFTRSPGVRTFCKRAVQKLHTAHTQNARRILADTLAARCWPQTPRETESNRRVDRRDIGLLIARLARHQAHTSGRPLAEQNQFEPTHLDHEENRTTHSSGNSRTWLFGIRDSTHLFIFQRRIAERQVIHLPT